MSITNGYCTLVELKQHLLDAATYTATTISFATTTNVITDTAKGLRRFQTGDTIQISGTDSNDGYFTIASGGNTVGSFTTTEALTTEAAGDTVTISVVQDQIDDAMLETAIEAASRAIDDKLNTRFYRNSSDEDRYYTAEYTDVFFCPDDIGSITTLATDSDADRTWGTEWESTDFDLMPFNASADGEPYRWIETTPSGNYSFVTVSKGLKLTGKFGWSTTAPAKIKKLTQLLAERLFKRKDLVFGKAGSPELGIMELETMLERDPEIQLLLSGPWVRVV